MLEATLSSGMGSNQTYPDSGPGPKTLKYGSPSLGYFGEVSATELFTLAELRRQANFWGGTDVTPSPTWVKMFLSERVIYFPTQILASGVSWYVLYLAGLVYGTDDNGVAPMGTPTNQAVYVFKEDYHFKVRCFKSQVLDPTPDPNISGGSIAIGTTDYLKAGEWGRVISAIISPRQAGYTGDNWNLYAAAGYFVGTSGSVPSQNSRSTDLTQYLGINNLQVTWLSKGGAAVPWFPVLELGEPDDIVYFPVKESSGATFDAGQPVVMVDEEYHDPINPIRSFSGGPQTNGRQLIITDPAYEDSFSYIKANLIKMSNTNGLPVIIDSVSYE